MHDSCVHGHMHAHVVYFKYSELRFLWKQGFYASTLETLVVQGKPGFLDSLIPNKGVDVVSPGVFVTAANDK